MSGWDRSILEGKLFALGWTEAAADVDCGSLSHCCLVPPDSLWKNKPASFYVYDAVEIHKLLGGEWNEDD